MWQQPHNTDNVKPADMNAFGIHAEDKHKVSTEW